MEETKEFKVGDRVYWAGDDFDEKDNGTIKSFRDSKSVWVLWDSDGGVLWVDLDELQHEQPEDKPEEYPTTFYNIQEDIPIGGFAKVGNEVYKVVGVKGCTLCEFITNRTHCEIARCSTSLRLDKRDVSLILYDTIPEDNDE